MNADFIYDKEYRNNIFAEYEIKFKEFENCTFNHCDFTLCNFLGTVFIDCTFYHCNFREAKVGHIGMRNAVFNDCDFTSVNFAMTDQILHEFHFNNSLLDYSQFYALKLKRISFTNCSMVSVDFMKTDLTEALFDNCNLRLAVFTDANCEKTDFYSSFDFNIDPEKTKLKKAIFSSEGIKGLLTKYNLVIKD
ncbi:MAG TPA: pentapeptide repeat-containing protein [Flavobacterium sp.]|uniref:pentapeptide repeat-containing protein n=1 Tax=Flavobacterium sp. TaxID=239 RepID=UPI002CFFA8F6|nr:pentapeptide repeat-containing protein [Flavobacterium sp.]HSD13956.1 pentapeptide repeat-containing protein [Flavobacterium sp.]